MPTWFTADMHFGHANIIRYSRRPFASVQAMDIALSKGPNNKTPRHGGGRGPCPEANGKVV